MANEHIGRKRSWGIGAEDPAARGTSVAAEVWMKRDTGDILPDQSFDEDDSAMGIIDAVLDSSLAKNKSKIPFGGRVRDHSIGYFLLGLLGSETLVQCCTISGHGGTGDPARGDTVSSSTGSFTGTIKKIVLIGTETYYFISEDTGTLSNQTDLTDGAWTGGTVDFSTFAAVKGHFFSRLNTNTHPSFTAYTSDDVSDVQSTNAMMNDFSLSAVVGEPIMFTANFIGKAKATPSTQTPAFVTDNSFVAGTWSVKFADDEAALGAATASALQSFNLSSEKNLLDIYESSSTSVSEIFNQSLRFSGDLEALYNAETFRGYVENETKQACRVALVNSSAPLIYDATAEADDIYPSIYVDLMRNSFSEWARDDSKDDIVKQTMGFVPTFDTDEAATLEILLLNTTAAGYAHS